MTAVLPTSSEKGPAYLLAREGDGERAKGSPHLFKASASNTAGRFDFLVSTFEPMTGPPLHVHDQQDDTFYVLEGIITVQAGDDLIDLGPGDFLSIPKGVAHTFDNLRNGGKPARAVNLMTPGGLLDVFEAMAGAAEGGGGPDAIGEAAARYGTTMVGPPLRVTLDVG